ncbi:collagen-binding domain-containing protein, partial [Vagococcus sp.]
MSMSKKNVVRLLGFLLLFCLGTVSHVNYEAASKDVKDAGNFYDDVPEARNNELGAAKYFHIFANKANLRNHTNGNVATRELSGDANFGTSHIKGTEYNYAQRVTNINAASGIQNHTKMVFGKNVSIDLSEYNRPKVNGRQMDRVSGDDIYQDKNENEYINFDQEFKKLNQASQTFINQPVEKSYSNKDFEGKPERIIDVSLFNSKDIYINLKPEVLSSDKSIIISGLEKNQGNGDFKNVYINVDTGNSNSYTVNSQIIFEYTDGSRRGNKETTDFSDSTVLWTFSSDNKPFVGDINLDKTWLGSILAPSASLGGGQNIDGNIIVDNFRGAGETHGWDWQVNKGRIILTKVSETMPNKLLEGAEFSLFKDDGKNIPLKTHLKTDSNGRLEVLDLSFGSYYFIETKAPKGYELSEEKYSFTINLMNNNQTIEITATNKEQEEPKLGSVILTKVSESDNQTKLPGAEFS